MKNLANCKPSEFLKQTNKIKHSVEKWLTATDIMNIRKRQPDFVRVSENSTQEERAKVKKTNDGLMAKQTRENLSAIFDAILDEHPDETLELLALLCFVEPKDVDEHPVEDYLTALTEMLNNQAVIGFFTSLGKWGLTGI